MMSPTFEGVVKKKGKHHGSQTERKKRREGKRAIKEAINKKGYKTIGTDHLLLV